MIDVITNVTYKEQNITLFGKINEVEQDFELNCLMQDISIRNFYNTLIYSLPSNLVVLDIKAHSYVMYDCRFTRSTLSISNASVMTIKGYFSRLVKENEVDKKYDTVIWSFDGLEHFFSLESFDTEFESDGLNLKFIKPKTKIQKIELANGVIGEILSDYTGLLRSTKLYNLSVEQRKVIKLLFKDKVSKEDIDKEILKVKKYFEFITKQELKINCVIYKNENPIDNYDGTLISDSMLQTKTIVKKLKEKPFRGGDENLFAGMKAWTEQFDSYQDVIDIWQKTIYNSNVTRTDKFIWFCQAFELLCTINSKIYEKAIQNKDSTQRYPNLKNFLCATNELFNIWDGISTEHFKDVKVVRDKLTHNNPDKIVTDTQKENAYQIIELFFIKTIEALLGIKGIPLCVMLKSD